MSLPPNPEGWSSGNYYARRKRYISTCAGRVRVYGGDGLPEWGGGILFENLCFARNFPIFRARIRIQIDCGSASKCPPRERETERGIAVALYGWVVWERESLLCGIWIRRASNDFVSNRPTNSTERVKMQKFINGSNQRKIKQESKPFREKKLPNGYGC